MTDYVKATREAAIKHGLDPNIFQRQIKQESNFDPKANSGSALGIAQFTPETAKGLGINPQDPIQSLNGAAGLMARYVKQYGNYEDALTAYNAGPGRVGKPLYAETQHYIKTILGSSGKRATGTTKLVTQRAATPGTPPTTTTSPDTASFEDAQRKVLLARLLQKTGQNSQNNALFATGLLDPSANPQQSDYMTTTTTPGTPGTVADSVVRTTGKTQPHVKGSFTVAPGANRKGVALTSELQNFVTDVAGHSQKTLNITTGTNHNQLTVNGKVSDHWAGNGADFAVPDDSHDGDMLAAHAMVAAGVPWKQAEEMARKGGLYNLTPTKGQFKGKRVQVIWKTNEGGNHHNHVHIGIR